MGHEQIEVGGKIPPAPIRTIITDFAWMVDRTPAGGSILVIGLTTTEQLLLVLKPGTAKAIAEHLTAPTVHVPNNNPRGG